jgi:hypothetical protein
MHHKEDNSGWEINFKKSLVMGSIPKDSSVKGSIHGWKDTFSVYDKRGDIYHMHDRNDWGENT